MIKKSSNGKKWKQKYDDRNRYGSVDMVDGKVWFVF